MLENKKNINLDIDQTDESVLQASDLQEETKTIDKPTNAKRVPFAVVESYKTMRTNLLFLLDHSSGNNIITVTSANASEGKSTTAVNLAVAFSQLNNKVLIIDADMRRSSIHRKLKLENDIGLSNVLAGFSDAKSAIKKINDAFYVLTAGQIPPNPSELLGAQGFERLL
ncbi:MAG: CpsD/CapB family tyrosine-protein kinase, partial [Clostridia bacterium]|nr:CpsD/CapB family tyrosine-protein kinase [Clostridia bacterium]